MIEDDMGGGNRVFEDGDGGYINISSYVWEQIVEQVIHEYKER